MRMYPSEDVDSVLQKDDQCIISLSEFYGVRGISRWQRTPWFVECFVIVPSLHVLAASQRLVPNVCLSYGASEIV